MQLTIKYEEADLVALVQAEVDKLVVPRPGKFEVRAGPSYMHTVTAEFVESDPEEAARRAAVQEEAGYSSLPGATEDKRASMTASLKNGVVVVSVEGPNGAA